LYPSRSFFFAFLASPRPCQPPAPLSACTRPDRSALSPRSSAAA
jgi:hypothetical protein